MIPSPFSYVRATDVVDALRLLDEGGSEAKVLAGGQSLIPMMKLRLANPTRIVDLGGIAPLRTVDVTAQRVRLGALVTHADVAADPALRAALPALTDAAAVIGDPQVRNFGTIGGSSAHSDPGADYPAVMLALAATFTLTSAAGAREVAAGDFFVGMYETSLHANREILTAIAFEPAPYSAYVKLEHPASGYAIAGAAVRVRVVAGAIAEARVALTGIGEVAFRARGVEAALLGNAVDDERAVTSASREAAAGVDAHGDVLAPADYRLAMADVVVRRAVLRALRRGER